MEARKLDLIQEIAESYYNLPLGSIQLNTRKREVVQARQIAIFFAKQLTKLPQEFIGNHYAKRGHCTVIHSIKTVNNLIDTNRQFREDFTEIQKRILNKLNEPIISKEEICSTITNAVMKRFVYHRDECAHYREWNDILKEMVNN